MAKKILIEKIKKYVKKVEVTDSEYNQLFDILNSDDGNPPGLYVAENYILGLEEDIIGPYHPSLISLIESTVIYDAETDDILFESE